MTACGFSTRSAPMSEQAIYWNTCQLTDELFGRCINPHLFRDCAASAIANDDPNASWPAPGSSATNLSTPPSVTTTSLK